MGCCVSYTYVVDDRGHRPGLSLSSDASPSKPLKRASHVASAGDSSHSGTASSPFLHYGELSLASSSLASYPGHGLQTAASAVFSEGDGTISEVTDASAANAALSAAHGAAPDAALRALLPIAELPNAPMRPDIADALTRTLSVLPDTSCAVSAARAHRALAATARPDALQHAHAGERRLASAGLIGVHGALLALLRLEAAAAHARAGAFAAAAAAADAARDAIACSAAPRASALELRAAMLLAECATRREDLPPCARAAAAFAALGRALDALSTRESAASARANLYCARARAALRLAAAPVCPCPRPCAPGPAHALDAAASLAALALRLLPPERAPPAGAAIPADAPLRRAVHHALGQTCAARAVAGAANGAREKALEHFDEAIRCTPWDDSGGHTLLELQMQRAAVRAIPLMPPGLSAAVAARATGSVEADGGSDGHDYEDDDAVFSCPSTVGTVRSRRSEGVSVTAETPVVQTTEPTGMAQKEGLSVGPRQGKHKTQ